VVIFFRDKSVSAIIFLIILALLVHVHFFFSEPQIVFDANDGVLSLILKNYLQSVNGTFVFIIYIVLLLLQAIRLNLILNETKMFQQAGYTTAMSYVLLSAFVQQWSAFSPAMISNGLVIWIFIKLSRLYNNQAPKTLLFNTGLLVGLTVIAYHPTAILVLVVLFALVVVRPFRLAEWMILILGILTPYYFLLSYLFLTDHWHLLYQFIPEIKLNMPVQHPDIWLIIDFGMMAVLLLLGIIHWMPANNRMIIQIRKNWSVLIVMLLIVLAIPFIFNNAGVQSAFLWTVPLSAFIANFFALPKKLWFPNLFFWLSLALIIHNNWLLMKI
jgi:hypothetical protein